MTASIMTGSARMVGGGKQLTHPMKGI